MVFKSDRRLDLQTFGERQDGFSKHRIDGGVADNGRVRRSAICVGVGIEAECFNPALKTQGNPG